MMGTNQPQKDLFSYQIDLDKRVRSDHPLRQIAGTVDFTFVRAAVAGSYGYNGNVSVDPTVVMKMMFLLFYDDVASERELMRIIPERLDYLWFLGYGLDDEIPNHSVLSKARNRWGVEVFEQLFVGIVRQCVEKGLVSGEKIHMDGSLVDANASRNSVVKGSEEMMSRIRAAVQSQVQKLDEEQELACRRKYHATVNDKAMSLTDPDAVHISGNRLIVFSKVIIPGLRLGIKCVQMAGPAPQPNLNNRFGFCFKRVECLSGFCGHPARNHQSGCTEHTQPQSIATCNSH